MGGYQSGTRVPTPGTIIVSEQAGLGLFSRTGGWLPRIRITRLSPQTRNKDRMTRGGSKVIGN